MADIDIFLQGEGIAQIILVRVPQDGKVRDIRERAQRSGVQLQGDEHTCLFLLENTQEVLDLDHFLVDVHIGHRSRVHAHRSHLLEVDVNFNGEQRKHTFSSATTVEHVFQWAVGPHGFHLEVLDATEHLLQRCCSMDRPDEDTHLGSLIMFPMHTVCFDLVPKVRVEG